MKLHHNINGAAFAAIARDKLTVIVFSVKEDTVGVCAGFEKNGIVDVPLHKDIGFLFDGETGETQPESNAELTVLAWRTFAGPWKVFDARCSTVLPIIDNRIEP